MKKPRINPVCRLVPPLITSEDIGHIEGKFLTLIEMLGLKQAQEDAAKSTVRQIVWDWWSHMYDREYVFYFSNSFYVARDGSFVKQDIKNPPSVGSGVKTSGK